MCQERMPYTAIYRLCANTSWSATVSHRCLVLWTLTARPWHHFAPLNRPTLNRPFGGPFLAFARGANFAPRSSRRWILCVPWLLVRRACLRCAHAQWPAVAKGRPSAVADSTLAVCHSSAAARDRARPARDGREGHHPPPAGASPRLGPPRCVASTRRYVIASLGG